MTVQEILMGYLTLRPLFITMGFRGTTVHLSIVAAETTETVAGDAADAGDPAANGTAAAAVTSTRVDASLGNENLRRAGTAAEEKVVTMMDQFPVAGEFRLPCRSSKNS
ncbi:UNVERIFIED_CONTAM: hypothetical protein RF648_11695 [Kocuria sp. CPCC 205274]